MEEKTIQELLKSTFAKNTIEDWIAIASSEIKTGHPLQELAWKSEENLIFRPLYDKSDISELQYLNAFDLVPSQNPSDARSWLNLPIVFVRDEIKANFLALDHLNNGADGILFEIPETNTDLSALLHTIEWPHCTLSFLISHSSFAETLLSHIATTTDKASTLRGTLFWKNKPVDFASILNQFSGLKKIKCIGLIIDPSSPVEEIATALTQALAILTAVTDKGIPADRAIQSISFSLPVETNFFISIAKFKVLRMLWYQVTQAYGVTEYAPSSLAIHARVTVFNDEKFKPHGNMIKGTTSSMAAILGGCDALTVCVENPDDRMINRIARNVSNILREESHLNVVADSTAGSYALENIIHTMATQAWSIFQHNASTV